MLYFCRIYFVYVNCLFMFFSRIRQLNHSNPVTGNLWLSRNFGATNLQTKELHQDSNNINNLPTMIRGQEICRQDSKRWFCTHNQKWTMATSALDPVPIWFLNPRLPVLCPNQPPNHRILLIRREIQITWIICWIQSPVDIIHYQDLHCLIRPLEKSLDKLHCW